jgi:hypothetical protein
MEELTNEGLCILRFIFLSLVSLTNAFLPEVLQIETL